VTREKNKDKLKNANKSVEKLAKPRRNSLNNSNACTIHNKKKKLT